MSNDQRREEMKQRMSRLWDRTKDVLLRGRDEVIKASRVSKLNLDRTSLQRHRRRLLLEVGERTNQLVREGKLQAALFGDNLSRVEVLEREIASLQQEIQRLTAAGTPVPPAPAADPNDKDEY